MSPLSDRRPREVRRRSCTAGPSISPGSRHGPRSGTANDETGWIPAGYLDKEPPPRVRLEQLETETQRLREQLEKVDAEATELRTTNESLSSSDAERSERLERLDRENVALRAGARWPHWITGALILSTGMVLGALLSRISGRGRRQRIRL